MNLSICRPPPFLLVSPRIEWHMNRLMEDDLDVKSCSNVESPDAVYKSYEKMMEKHQYDQPTSRPDSATDMLTVLRLNYLGSC